MHDLSCGTWGLIEVTFTNNISAIPNVLTFGLVNTIPKCFRSGLEELGVLTNKHTPGRGSSKTRTAKTLIRRLLVPASARAIP